ncbi:MAG TPA: hypothetical protein VNU19_20640 [Candidatus Acidoferrum sp.]|jgi:hypothetical protein|nr:hypothetical protein [Candidatus Acidoferrum sp.]
MADPPPIACTLSTNDLRDRERAWVKLLASGVVRRDVVPGGIRLTAEPGAASSLLELIELERECCAWIQFEVRDGVAVTMTAADEGEALLAEMFKPL